MTEAITVARAIPFRPRRERLIFPSRSCILCNVTRRHAATKSGIFFSLPFEVRAEAQLVILAPGISRSSVVRTSFLSCRHPSTKSDFFSLFLSFSRSLKKCFLAKHLRMDLISAAKTVNTLDHKKPENPFECWTHFLV